eukprot:c8354_g1_i1.p1 GENE.c8354_g1_i1~~c8354_g1_i1.p1  ORF type:complete len:798 (-),score=165.40 c8354_g1_i1:116-2404(-)
MENQQPCVACLRISEAPISLPCNHTVCRACSMRITAIYERNFQTLPCALCATNPKRDGPVAVTIPKQNNKVENSVSKCPNCDVRTAAVQCAECGPMCRECSVQIHSVKIFQNHVINPIGASTPSARGHRDFPLCADHNEEKKLFCEQCSCLVCHFCLLVGSHRDPVSGSPHPCSAGETAVAGARQNISDRLGVTTNAIRDIAAVTTELQNHSTVLSQSVTQAQQNINEHFVHLERLLKSRREFLLTDLQRKAEEYQAQVQAQRRRADHALAQFEVLRSSANDMVNLADTAYILEYGRVLAQRIDELDSVLQSMPRSDSVGPKILVVWNSLGDDRFNDEGTIVGDAELSSSPIPTTNTDRRISMDVSTNRSSTPVSDMKKRLSVRDEEDSSRSTANRPKTWKQDMQAQMDALSSKLQSKTQIGKQPLSPAPSAAPAPVASSALDPYRRQSMAPSPPVIERVNFAYSSVQLVDSSPDVLHVGTDGMMRFYVTLSTESKMRLDPTHLLPEDTERVRRGLWVQTEEGIRDPSSDVVIQGDELLMVFVPSQSGPHSLCTSIGSPDGNPLCLSTFIVEPELPPLPLFLNVQKGLDINSSGASIRVVKRTAAGWRVAQLERDFQTDKKETVFCWEVRVDDFADHENHPHKVFVGVTEVGTSMDTLCSKQTLNTDHVWGVYLASGKKIRKDKEAKIVQGIKGFGPGDVCGILIEIDREKSTMSLFKNGKLQGLAFRAIPRETTPIIGITGAGNQVSVVRFVEGENIFSMS